jgi:hypothetical protein
MAFFFQGGTTTPFTVYSDSGESSAYPNPVLADSDGRWPNVFVPYTVSYDVQVKSADGVQLTFTAQIPNPNPVDVTTIVDPASILTTGMIHGEMINTVKAGYVRLNGNTIGSSATSGTATERANNDTLNLFTYLWNLDPTVAPVSGGRGTSAASDFSPGNKVITLPDWRGIGPMGLDDMGAAAGGFFTGLTFTVGNATMAGALTGANGISITTSNMPAHSHGGTTSNQSADHTHGLSVSGTINVNTGVESVGHSHHLTFQSGGQSVDHAHSTSQIIAGGGLATVGQAQGNLVGPTATGGTSVDHSHLVDGDTGAESANHVHNINTTPTFTGTSAIQSASHTHTFTTNTQGSGTSFNNLSRKRLVTWFIKL